MIEDINEIEMIEEDDIAYYNERISAGFCSSCGCYAGVEELKENEGLCRNCNESVKDFNEEFEKKWEAGETVYQKQRAILERAGGH